MPDPSHIYQSHIFHPTILRAYDIRGIVGETLHVEDARAIGHAFGLLFEAGARIAIGRDGRLSSPDLATALSEGLVDAGCHVLDIGVGPTPMLYFADVALSCAGAIQVTGSHNPPTHNGFKMVRAHRPFYGADIQQLGTDALTLKGRAGGRYETQDIIDLYTEKLADQADFGNLSAVWDTGNGAAGPALISMLEKIDKSASENPAQHCLFTEIDGTFPNHHPNPVDPETLDILRDKVSEMGADLGIGFDGDGDRIGVIDQKGRQVAGDLLTALLARDVLERHPGAPILFDVKSSELALELVRQAGGKPMLWKTGHSHMKEKMREIGAPIAGEMSGHIFIKDRYYGFDDALYVAMRLVSLLNQKQLSMADFLDSLPDLHASPEIGIACPDEEKFALIDRLSAKLKANLPDGYTLTDIDGVRLGNADGWWLLRPSNTEAKLVTRAEGRTADLLEKHLKMVQNALKEEGLDWSY